MAKQCTGLALCSMHSCWEVAWNRLGSTRCEDANDVCLLLFLVTPTGPTIPTAVNIPLDMLSDAVRAGQLDPYHTSSIAVVCASGQRSAQATVRLTKVFAFKNVSNVSGGMSAWQQMQAELKGGSGGCGCGSSSGGCSK